MKQIIINSIKLTFDKVIEFKQHDTNLLECFFFSNENLVGSKFLTVSEFNSL